MGHPKRHHYLPESYLKRFTTERGLWVYDIEKEELRPQTAHNTGTEGYFNAIEDQDGNRDFSVEEALSKVEDAFARLMPKIENREALVTSDREILAYFMALQMLRGPDFHDDVNRISDRMLRQFTQSIMFDPDRGEALWNQALSSTDGDTPVSFAEAREFVLNGEYSIQTLRNRTLELMIELAPALAEWFLKLDWVVLCAPAKKAFVTCDRPFSVVPPRARSSSFRGAGIATPGAVKIIPLSMSKCLLLGDPGGAFGYSDADQMAVRTTNLNICHGANRYVIGRDRELVGSLVKEVIRVHCATGTRWGGSRVTI